MKLTDKTATTLNWLAAFFLVPGVLIISPAGRILFVVLAAIIALIPLVFSNGKRRVFAGIVFGIALLLAFVTYPDFNKDQDAYRDRVRQKSSAPVQQ